MSEEEIRSTIAEARTPTHAELPEHERATVSLTAAKAARRHAARAERDPDLPDIRVTDGELPRVVDEAETALLKSGQGLYQRGGMLVRPYIERVPCAAGSMTLSYRMSRPSIPHLRECMTRSANFLQFDARSSDYVLRDCPRDIAEAYAAREGQWKVPPLRAVITAPTLRPDGSLLNVPGYDAHTALLFDPCAQSFPAVSGTPTRDDALAAIRYLRELIASYPFVDPQSEAVALSGILTATVRRTIGTAPMHAITSPVPGSGKTHLVDVICSIATGQRASVISQSRLEEETEKRIAAAIIAGDPFISLDNCTAPVGGSLLCVAVTQEAVRIRILGQSFNADVPSNAMIFATGNNLQIGDDMARRTLMCALDPQLERPELREFENDPLTRATAQRPRYIAAALLILRAFHFAGRPARAPQLGSFSEWSSLVRNALLWLDQADPAETMERAREADAKLRALGAVMDQWEQIPVLMERRKKVSEIIAVASEEEGMPGGLRFRYPDFRDALMAVAGEGNSGVNSRRLGKWLAANRDRVCNGRRIVADGTHAGIVLWKLELVESP
ncbi:MAG: hypothetical protein KGJ66_04205 [Alphaproteobacteria bacterium]|nr:hypothetical protein [Alphaproteobacteria bacterium]